MFDTSCQLCWRCSKSCGGCSWSRRFQPIQGWEAEPTIVKQISNRRDAAGKRIYITIKSYKITACPMFKEG